MKTYQKVLIFISFALFAYLGYLVYMYYSKKQKVDQMINFPLPFEDKFPEPKADFKKKLIEISVNLGIPAKWLIGVMWKESNINPKALNPISKAAGLIQWMPNTLSGDYGITTEQILSMNAVKQLEYVEKYYSRYRGKLKSFGDMYLAVFYPAALNKSLDFVIGSERNMSGIIASQNVIIDLDKSGYITKSEFYKYAEKGLPNEILIS